jgi:serine/threonine protein kinase
MQPHPLPLAWSFVINHTSSPTHHASHDLCSCFAIPFISCRRFKLGDFGLAIDTNLERSKSRVGTLDYMSPEVGIPCTEQLPARKPMTNHGCHYAAEPACGLQAVLEAART